MPILLVVILFACVIGIVLALITISLQKISGRVVEQYKERLDDANDIMESGVPPHSWVEKYRKRIEGADGVSPDDSQGPVASSAQGWDESVEKTGEQARRHCLKRLKTLTSFMEKGNFYDEDATRDMVVKSLKAEQDRWTTCHWAELLLGASKESRE